MCEVSGVRRQAEDRVDLDVQALSNIRAKDSMLLRSWKPNSEGPMMLTEGRSLRGTSCAKCSTISRVVRAKALVSVSRTGWVEANSSSACSEPGSMTRTSPSRCSCRTLAVALRVMTIISGRSRRSISRSNVGSSAGSPASVASLSALNESGGVVPSRSNIASMIVV